MAIGTPL